MSKRDIPVDGHVSVLIICNFIALLSVYHEKYTLSLGNSVTPS